MINIKCVGPHLAGELQKRGIRTIAGLLRRIIGRPRGPPSPGGSQRRLRRLLPNARAGQEVLSHSHRRDTDLPQWTVISEFNVMAYKSVQALMCELSILDRRALKSLQMPAIPRAAVPPALEDRSRNVVGPCRWVKEE